MSERTERFEVGDQARLDVGLPAGNVVVTQGEPGVIEVTVRGANLELFLMEQRGDTVHLSVERVGFSRLRTHFDVLATVPAGIELAAKLASADLVVEVELRELNASLSSGDLRARDVTGAAQVRVASGDMRLGHVAGKLTVSGASGDLHAESAGELEVAMASGDVTVGRVQGRAQVNTAAGDVHIGSFDGAVCECRTMSGDVRLGIPPGRTLDVDAKTMTGDVRSLFEPGEGEPEGERVPASLRVKTMAGDVVFGPAAQLRS